MDTATLPPQIGEALEKGQQSALNSAKTVVSDISNTVSDQVGIKNEAGAQTQSQPQNSTASEPPNTFSQEDLDSTREVVSDFYAPSQTPSNQSLAELEEQQTQVQLTQVRQQLAQQLHEENYFGQVRGGPTYLGEILNAGSGKSQAEVSEQEEMEQAKEQDKMQDLQVQQKKNEDIAKFKAERQVEIKGGVVG